MRRLRRTTDVPVGPGERVLAQASASDGSLLAGTRDAFYVVAGADVTRVAWEDVEAADWDRDTDRFRLSEVGSWGQERREHVVTITDPGRLLELVRERVTASVVLQRRVDVLGRRGLRVIARRAPGGHQPVKWVYEYDEGIDPTDPTVAQAAREALAQAVADVGMP